MNNYKNLSLIALAVVSFTYGAFAQYMHPGISAPSDLIFLIISAALIFFWFSLDAKEIKYKRGYILNVGVIGIAIIALPYYFFRSRGFKKGLIYTLIFMLIIVLWYVVQYSGAIAVYYVFQS